MLDWGRAIRVLRAERGFTQKQLADMTHTSPSRISLIECGRRDPNLRLLELYASHLRAKLAEGGPTLQLRHQACQLHGRRCPCPRCVLRGETDADS